MNLIVRSTNSTIKLISDKCIGTDQAQYLRLRHSIIYLSVFQCCEITADIQGMARDIQEHCLQ